MAGKRLQEGSPEGGERSAKRSPPTLSLKMLATLADQSPRSTVLYSPDFLSSPRVDTEGGGGSGGSALRDARAANAELHRAKEQLQQELLQLREELEVARGARWAFSANVRRPTGGRGTFGCGTARQRASPPPLDSHTSVRADHLIQVADHRSTPDGFVLDARAESSSSSSSSSSGGVGGGGVGVGGVGVGGGSSASMPAPAARSRLPPNGGSISPPSSTLGGAAPPHRLPPGAVCVAKPTKW